MLELHIKSLAVGWSWAWSPGNSSAGQLWASCWAMKNAHFIVGIEGSFFTLEVDVAAGFALEENSFEILIFSVRKTVKDLVL